MKQRNKLQHQQLLSMLKPPNDFRQLSVMPEWDDVCTNDEPFLRPNIINGSYSDVDTYLDIQFRLLREDFFSPLREGLLAFRNQTEKKQKNIRRMFFIRRTSVGHPSDVYYPTDGVKWMFFLKNRLVLKIKILI